MSHQATATAGLPAHITAALRHDSTVTVDDALVRRNGEDNVVWSVLVDGEIVDDFLDDDDGENEAGALAEEINERIAKLVKRRAYLTGLRDLANFLEAHTEIPEPTTWAIVWPHFGGGPEALRAAIEALRPIGVDVEIDMDKIKASHDFGPIKLEVEAYAEHVCEERTEVREVREKVLPDWARVEPDGTELVREAA